MGGNAHSWAQREVAEDNDIRSANGLLARQPIGVLLYERVPAGSMDRESLRAGMCGAVDAKMTYGGMKKKISQAQAGRAPRRQGNTMKATGHSQSTWSTIWGSVRAQGS